MKYYHIKEGDKDPIIDMMRTLIDTRVEMEGISFNRVLHLLEKETSRELRYGTLSQWFYGPTRFPRYSGVARLYLAMRAYSRKPIQIGDIRVEPVNLLAASRRKVA